MAGQQAERTLKRWIKHVIPVRSCAYDSMAGLVSTAEWHATFCKNWIIKASKHFKKPSTVFSVADRHYTSFYHQNRTSTTYSTTHDLNLMFANPQLHSHLMTHPQQSSASIFPRLLQCQLLRDGTHAISNHTLPHGFFLSFSAEEDLCLSLALGF